jgi:hypothetical protein
VGIRRQVGNGASSIPRNIFTPEAAATERRVVLAEGNHALEEAEHILIGLQLGPIEPSRLIVLVIRVVVAKLRIQEFISSDQFQLPGTRVLLDGSGTDNQDFVHAIAAGIDIVHINTELRVAWRRSLEGSLISQPNEVVPYKILPPVVDSVKQVVGSRLKLFGAQMTSNEIHLSAAS